MYIIELAKQAGFFVADNEVYSPSNQADHELTKYIEAFAALVAAAARADEREECAKVIELHAGIIDTPNAFIDGPSNFAKTKARDLADSIRDRGTP